MGISWEGVQKENRRSGRKAYGRKSGNQTVSRAVKIIRDDA